MELGELTESSALDGVTGLLLGARRLKMPDEERGACLRNFCLGVLIAGEDTGALFLRNEVPGHME